MPNASAPYQCFLKCHHYAYFYPVPQPGEILYCRSCRDYRQCLRVYYGWKLRCEHRGCQVARIYMGDEAGTRRAAIRHLRDYPDHTVRLLKGNDVVETITDPDSVTLPLPAEAWGPVV